MFSVVTSSSGPMVTTLSVPASLSRFRLKPANIIIALSTTDDDWPILAISKPALRETMSSVRIVWMKVFIGNKARWKTDRPE